MSTPQPFPAHRDRSQPAIERFEWLNSLTSGRNGTEHIEGPLRAFPRMSYQWSVLLPPGADKTPLAALRTSDEFVVPLWPHAFQRPDLAPSAGIATTSPQVFALSSDSRGTLTSAAAFAWSVSAYIAAPAVRARPLETTRSIAYTTSRIQSAAVAFRLLDFKEVVPAYAGAKVGSVWDLSPFVPYWTSPQETVTVAVNAEDAGHLDFVETLFKRRAFTLQVRLTTRAQVVAFRSFLHALKGRLTPLAWAAPGEAVSTWRLDSDTVEISYESPRLASCALAISQPIASTA